MLRKDDITSANCCAHASVNMAVPGSIESGDGCEREHGRCQVPLSLVMDAKKLV